MKNKLKSAFLAFSGGAGGKVSACNAGDARDNDSISGLGSSPGGGNGNPLQYSCLEKSMDRMSLAGYSPWSCKELGMPEHLNTKCFLGGHSWQIPFIYISLTRTESRSHIY